MSEVDSDKISARLHQAVDDHPVDVPDLLTPARSRRRRRRVLGGTAAVAVVVTGALAVSQLLSSAPRTALVAATPSPTVVATSAPAVTPSPAILTNDTIALRCGPQMVKYDALPQFARMTNPWHVAHVAHSYRVGDIVAMLPANQHTYPAYCRIPAVGHESDEVPFAALEPAALTALERVAMCSESMSISDRSVVLTGQAEPSVDFTTPDLRDAGIFAAASAGKMMVLLLAQGTTSYACFLYPQPWDFGGVGMGAVGDTRGLDVGLRGSAAGAAGKSVVPGPATYYSAVGRLPANARTIEFTISKKVVDTVTADANGWWVAAFMVDGRNSMSEPSTYAIKDAAGTVLKSAKFWG
jgi:hypothetical protein